MDLFDVFNTERERAPIEYEQFKQIGWTPNDYFRYMSFCDEIRSATILSFRLEHLTAVRYSDGQKKEGKPIEIIVADLFDWLQKFTERKLPKPVGAEMWFLRNIKYQRPKPFEHSENDEKPNPSIIYVSQHHFTSWVEGYISNIIHGRQLLDFNTDVKEENDPNKVDRRISEIKLELNSLMPSLPEDLVEYYRITKWARDQTRYDELMDELYELYHEKERLHQSVFKASTETLYIYYGQNIICFKQHHNIKSVNCDIKMPEGRAIINAQYCNECKKFIISNESYCAYRARYMFLPIRFQCVEEDGSFPTSNYSSLPEQSVLKLAGYSVNQRDDLSEDERRKILVFMIENGIIEKHEVIRHLEGLLFYNQNNTNMLRAIPKWKSDLDFIRSYNMENQDTAGITDIQLYQRR